MAPFQQHWQVQFRASPAELFYGSLSESSEVPSFHVRYGQLDSSTRTSSAQRMLPLQAWVTRPRSYILPHTGNFRFSSPTPTLESTYCVTSSFCGTFHLDCGDRRIGPVCMRNCPNCQLVHTCSGFATSDRPKRHIVSGTLVKSLGRHLWISHMGCIKE